MDERTEFEAWYAANAADYEANPIGSHDCDQQRRGWMARSESETPDERVVECDRQLSGVLHELAGLASMCWKPSPSGVFDTEMAIQFVERSVAELRQILRRHSPRKPPPAGRWQLRLVLFDEEGEPIGHREAEPPEMIPPLNWSAAPSRIEFGPGMAITDVEIDKNHTLTMFCEMEQAAHVTATLHRLSQRGLGKPVSWRVKVPVWVGGDMFEDRWAPCSESRVGAEPLFARPALAPTDALLDKLWLDSHLHGDETSRVRAYARDVLSKSQGEEA